MTTLKLPSLKQELVPMLVTVQRSLKPNDADEEEHFFMRAQATDADNPAVDTKAQFKIDVYNVVLELDCNHRAKGTF